ncbi:hypothetical protein FGO68_gene9590 [Halteria grandinella]|uniref:Uncharacterized protein n=1 Tax=Halteria grandinella TaxID=5974 RepID=A0A8J8T5B7_HALGN|nr:hypothetical protein FGO68_gene9590 [Halteria grandinella]
MSMRLGSLARDNHWKQQDATKVNGRILTRGKSFKCLQTRDSFISSQTNPPCTPSATQCLPSSLLQACTIPSPPM